MRGLLANETVTIDGAHVHLDGVELDYVYQERRAKDVPIYIGATGMQMMELTGEIADGVVLNYLVDPGLQRRGARGAGPRRGQGRPHASTTSTVRSSSCAASTTDRQAALDGARLMVTQYLGQQPHIMKASGVPQELLDEIGAGADLAGHPRAGAWRPAGWCPTTSCSDAPRRASPTRCGPRSTSTCASGCTCPILYPLGPDVELMIDTFARA